MPIAMQFHFGKVQQHPQKAITTLMDRSCFAHIQHLFHFHGYLLQDKASHFFTLHRFNNCVNVLMFRKRAPLQGLV